MKSLAALVVLVAAVTSQVMGDCIEGNCTEPVMSLDLQAIFPFFGPVNIDSDSDSDSVSDLSDDTIEPLPKINSSVPDNEVMSINFMEIISIADDSDSPPDLPDIFQSPRLQIIFGQKPVIEGFTVLDLSGKNLTGDEIADELQRRQPVHSLVLSNSRIQGLSMNTFEPVENTLQELHMDNCSVSLNAFYRLTNLRVLNLSNNGLTTFEWYPQLKDTLEVLDLSHNKLPEVRPELSVLTSLKNLNLSYNWIKSVNEYPLSLLPNLEVISLTMNFLNNATFTSLQKLTQVDLDWNYLRMFGDGVQLPSYRMNIKLASNPWDCNCGMIDARDNYNVQDLSILKCAMFTSHMVCHDNDCGRNFLPEEGGDAVATLTKESIHHHGCTGLMDQWYLFREGLTRLREHEPEKLLRLELLFLLAVLVVMLCLLLKQLYTKRSHRQSWLMIQQFPYLKISGLKKPEEVSYIKIDTPEKV
uniref:LRRCT domain-containing protein n=1 Tax=Homalodisca liturata TaxID=320908 RepID=A0A1B6HHK1_9HEMI